MQVQAIALTDFVHGDITAYEGKPVRHRDGNLINPHLAGELEKQGLVRIRTQPAVATPAKPVPVGKAQDDGQGLPSSVSPAAPVSQRPILHLPKGGNEKPRKSGGSS